MQKTKKKYLILEEESLDSLDISFIPGDRVFFVGDLGSGKTTLIRHLLRKYSNNPELIVRSPTYTYYERYPTPVDIYHFDLYRLENIADFHSIGGWDIAEDTESIMLIEWPEILENTIIPTKKISIKIGDQGVREITYETFSEGAPIDAL